MPVNKQNLEGENIRESQEGQEGNELSPDEIIQQEAVELGLDTEGQEPEQVIEQAEESATEAVQKLKSDAAGVEGNSEIDEITGQAEQAESDFVDEAEAIKNSESEDSGEPINQTLQPVLDSAKTIEQLILNLERSDAEVEGSQATYNGHDLADIVRNIHKGVCGIDVATRSGGFRAKVQELLENSRIIDNRVDLKEGVVPKFYLGETVIIPRSDGSTSEAKINYMYTDDETGNTIYEVSYTNEDGQPMHKRLMESRISRQGENQEVGKVDESETVVEPPLEEDQPIKVVEDPPQEENPVDSQKNVEESPVQEEATASDDSPEQDNVQESQETVEGYKERRVDSLLEGSESVSNGEHLIVNKALESTITVEDGGKLTINKGSDNKITKKGDAVVELLKDIGSQIINS